MATATELRELDDDDLLAQLTDLTEELFNLRFQNATGQLDNYSRLGEVRRDIARVQTVIRDREITAAESMAEEPIDD